MDQLLTGIIILGYAAGGTFFLRFWRETRDRLFVLFAIAFFILGLQRLLMGVLDPTNESLPLLFVIRLLAFILILIAIVDKNVRAKR
jgi:hypothetical protein